MSDSNRRDAGEFSGIGAEVAAYLGHADAQRATRVRAGADDWIAGLGRFGAEVVARAAIACARWALPSPVGPELQPMEDAVEAATRWVFDPSEANRVGARMEHDAVQRIRDGLSEEQRDADLLFELEICMLASQVVSDLRDGMPEHVAGELTKGVLGLGDESAEVAEAMRGSLLAWALGEADPLLEG